ncbi:MAG: lanthionine synthetase LanC family protein, partial [Acidobacteriota bacterium]
MQATWQPILEGELADLAWKAILAIYKDLGPAEQATEAIAGPAEWSLANGAAGKALFCAYLAEAKDDEAMAEQACDYLEMALESAARRRWAFSLWEGLLGVSWTYDHLAGRLFEAEDEPETSDIEELLMHSLQHSDGTFEYDLLHGLTGYGIACLEGRHRAGARQALDLILDHLTQTAEAFDGGIRWHTPPEDLPTWQRELAPEGYYN